MPFCSNCGGGLDTNSRFCPSCGTSTGTPAPPASQPLPPKQVLNILPQAKKMKMMGLFDSYTICFTARQVIFARFTSEVTKDVVRKSQAQSKAEGKGMFARVGAQMKAFHSAHLRYLEMSPEQILAEHKDNFAMEHAAVEAVRLKRGFEAGDEDGPGDAYTEIGFESNGNKYKYRIGLDIKEVYAILERFYSGRIGK